MEPTTMTLAAERRIQEYYEKLLRANSTNKQFSSPKKDSDQDEKKSQKNDFGTHVHRRIKKRTSLA
jgi:hypothetical protein